MANISAATNQFGLQKTNDTELQEDVVSLVNQLWGLPSDKKYVPCPNPSSLERKNLPTLCQNDYVVSPKIDGLRFFLLLGTNALTGEDYSVFIDRAYNIYPVQLISKQAEMFDGTLLDGECVPSSSGAYTYTVFDAVTVKGYDLKEQPFSRRKRAYEEAVASLQPHKKGLLLKSKVWYPKSEALQIYVENQSTCDGLILQPVQGLLKAGIQSDVFKWKPVSHQTIDFYLSVNKGVVYMECGNGSDIMSANDVDCYFDTDVPCMTLLTPFKKVYECCISRQKDNRLFFLIIKHRPDKIYANDVRVVVSTIKALQENITVEELC